MVELYTSEGCSSCPPADAWVSALKERDDLFKTVIPLAFHVDYWNYLGWRDEFSNAKYSARQRQYHTQGSTGSVYTPGFVINGEEWRGFFNPFERNRPPLNQAQETVVGELTLKGESDMFYLSFSPESDQSSNLIINLAYLGTDLSNNIRRGENAGRVLNHDFVVLTMIRKNLKQQDGEYQAVMRRAPVKHATAVAAWVSTRDDPTPIQAVGGWLAVHEAR